MQICRFLFSGRHSLWKMQGIHPRKGKFHRNELNAGKNRIQKYDYISSKNCVYIFNILCCIRAHISHGFHHRRPTCCGTHFESHSDNRNEL